MIFQFKILDRIRRLEFKIDRHHVFRLQKRDKKQLISYLYVRQLVTSDTLNIFMPSDVGKQKFVYFFFLIRCL